MEKLFKKFFYTQSEASDLFSFLCRNALPGEMATFLNQPSVVMALQNKDMGQTEGYLEDLLQSGNTAVIDEILQSKAFLNDKNYFHYRIVSLCVESANIKALQYFLEKPHYLKEAKKIINDQPVVISIFSGLSFNKEIVAYLINQHSVEKNSFFKHMLSKFSLSPAFSQDIADILEAKKIKLENKKLNQNIKKAVSPKPKNIRKI